MERLFDDRQILWRRLRARRLAKDGADFLMRRVAEDLEERLGVLKREFERCVLLDCLTDHAAEAVRRSEKARSVVRIEADRALFGPQDADDGVVAKDGVLPEDIAGSDLIISLMSLQDANDIPGRLIQIRRALRPDGLFLGAMAGSGTLAELRECLLLAETEIIGGAAMRVHPLADLRQAGSLLQRAGFALPVTDSETLTVRYSTMFALLQDLRAIGATSALADRPRAPLRRLALMRAAEIYQQRFADPDGKVRATFNVIWMSGWAPHESQQKPLKPGSATTALAKALDEIEAAEGQR